MFNIELINFALSARILFLVFLFVLPLFQFTETRDVIVLPKYALLAFGTSFLFILTLLDLVRTRIIRLPRSYILLVIFIVWIFCTNLWSVDPISSLSRSIELLNIFLLTFIAAQLFTTNKQRLSLIITCAITGTIVSIIGLQQAFGKNYFDLIQSAPPAATFGNKNIATQYLDLVFPISFFLIFIPENKYVKILISICSSLILSYILLTYARGAWLALISIILIIFYLLTKDNLLPGILKRNSKYIFFVFLIAGTIFSLPNSIDPQLKEKSLTTYNMSSGIRLSAYLNSMDMIIDKPLHGFGIGSFSTAFRPYMFSRSAFDQATETIQLVNTHSDPIQLTIETGVVGSSIFLCILILGLKRSRYLYNTSNQWREKMLILGTTLAILSMLVHSVVDFPMQMPASAILFWTLLVLLLSQNNFQDFRIPTKFIVLTGLFVIVFVYINYQHYSLQIDNNIKLKKLSTKLSEKNCDSASQLVHEIEYLQNYESRTIVPIALATCNFSTDFKLGILDKLIDYDKNHALARQIRGDLYFANRRYQEAEVDYIKVIEILPNRAAGYMGLSKLLILNGNNDNARILLDKAKLLEPENGNIDRLLLLVGGVK